MQEYDQGQLQKAVTQFFISLALISFLHYKMEIMQPLLFQVFLGPMQIWKNPLFKVLVMGESIARPFKEEAPNPFAALYDVSLAVSVFCSFVLYLNRSFFIPSFGMFSHLTT